MLRRRPLEPRVPNQEELRGILDALRRIVRDLRLGGRDAERTAGVSGAQLFVLQTLASGGVSSLNDLAARTLTDPSSVSVVVRRLVEQKLVARKVSKDDARRVELRLTVAGKKRLALCPEPTQTRLLASLTRMSRGDLSALTAGLAALMQEMGGEVGGDGAEPPMFFEEATPPKATRTPNAPKAASDDEPR